MIHKTAATWLLLFRQVNADLALEGDFEQIAPFSNVDYYATQIQNLCEAEGHDISDAEARTTAQQVRDLACSGV